VETQLFSRLIEHDEENGQIGEANMADLLTSLNRGLTGPNYFHDNFKTLELCI